MPEALEYRNIVAFQPVLEMTLNILVCYDTTAADGNLLFVVAHGLNSYGTFSEAVP